MSMGLEPKWTDLSDMLATCTDDQLLKWKEVAENPRIDNYRSITTLRQLVVDLYNKSIKDIIDELSSAVDNELNSRNGNINIDEKLEERIARLEKILSNKNEARADSVSSIAKEFDKFANNVSKLTNKFDRDTRVSQNEASRNMIRKALEDIIAECDVMLRLL